MRLGILGGTFDPVHSGHLVVAQEAFFKYRLDKVIFITSAKPPHKPGTGEVPFEDRLKMVELAISGNPDFESSDLEASRGGNSYTIDTLKELRQLYGEEPELFFIVGADAIREILTWKNPDELFLASYFIAASRPGYTLDNLNQALPEIEEVGELPGSRLFLMGTPGINVSSTMVRERIKSGEPFRYLVPDAVWLYIRENGLYL